MEHGDSVEAVARVPARRPHQVHGHVDWFVGNGRPRETERERDREREREKKKKKKKKKKEKKKKKMVMMNGACVHMKRIKKKTGKTS